MLLCDFKLHIDADSIRQYLEVLQKPATWGEGIVLSAAAMLYQRRICVYSENGVRPINIDGSALDINQNPELYSIDDDTCIRMGCVGNVHYVSIERDHSNQQHGPAESNSSTCGATGNAASGQNNKYILTHWCKHVCEKKCTRSHIAPNPTQQSFPNVFSCFVFLTMHQRYNLVARLIVDPSD